MQLLFSFVFFFNATATTEIYTVSDTLSLHDALPISCGPTGTTAASRKRVVKGSTTRSEEHTSELQSPDTISYAVFCLKKKITNKKYHHMTQHRMKLIAPKTK